MSSAPPPAPIDYITLGDFMAALAYPVRLALLDQLRTPKALHEIEVTPHRVHRGHNPDRPVARQTIKEHLGKLMDWDLVTAHETELDGKAVAIYSASPSRIYALAEELRQLSLRYAGRGAGSEETGTLATPDRADQVHGPRLVLAHGVYEGRVFPLTGRTAIEGAWTIGRDRRSSIALDYDPFVSATNARIRRKGAAYWIEDLHESKNGTFVNWARVATGEPYQLETGDLIGVGRSLLCFRSE